MTRHDHISYHDMLFHRLWYHISFFSFKILRYKCFVYGYFVLQQTKIKTLKLFKLRNMLISLVLICRLRQTDFRFKLIIRSFVLINTIDYFSDTSVIIWKKSLRILNNIIACWINNGLKYLFLSAKWL